MTTPILKMARGRQALTNVLNASNSQTNLTNPKTVVSPPLTVNMKENSVWEQHSKAIRGWMVSNPLKLGIPNDGCFDTVTAQLDRGDSCVDAREKCWDHILLELRHCGGSVDGLGFDFSSLNEFDEEKGAFMKGLQGKKNLTTNGGQGDEENITPVGKVMSGTPTGRGTGSAAVMALRNNQLVNGENDDGSSSNNLLGAMNAENLKLDLDVVFDDNQTAGNSDDTTENEKPQRTCGSMSAREKETPCNFNDIELIKANEGNRAQTAGQATKPTASNTNNTNNNNNNNNINNNNNNNNTLTLNICRVDWRRD